MSDVALKLNNGNTVYVTQEFADKMVEAGKGELVGKRQFSRAMFSGVGEGVAVDVAASGDTRDVSTSEMTSELADRAYNTRFEDRGGTAFIGSALSGATFGLSDVVAKHVFGVNMEVQDSIRSQNSTASLAGTITGAVGSALMTGGSGLLAKGAALTPAGRTAVAGEKVAAALGGGVKGMAAQGAVEGGAMAALQTISDMSVGRKDFSAEALLSEIGHGAILGGAVGGGLGVVAKGATKALGRMERNAEEAAAKAATKGDIAPAYATKGDDGIYRIPGDEVKAPKDAPRVTAANMKTARDQSVRTMREFDNLVNSAEIKAVAHADAVDEVLAMEQRWARWERDAQTAFDSAGLHTSEKWAKLGKSPEEALKLGQARSAWREAYHKSNRLNKIKDAAKAGDTEALAAHLSSQRAAAEELAQKYPELQKVLDSLPERLDVPYHIVENANAARLDLLAKTVKENPLFLARTEDELNTAINAAAEFRVEANKFLGKSDKFDKQIRKLDEAIAKFDPENGFQGFDDIALTKDRFAALWAKERMLQHADQAPGFVKKTWDKMKGEGSGGMMVGAMLGAGMDSMMGALGLGVLMKSDMVKSVLGYGMKKGLGLAAKADSPVVWRSIVSGTNLSPAQRKTYFQDEERKLASVINSQESVAQSIRDNLPEMFVSPHMMSTAITRSMTAAAYLLGKLPAVLGDKSPFGLGSKFVPSASDVEKYARIKAVANNPMYAVGRFADGKISPEEAETFRELWPELHREAVMNIMNNLDTVRDTLSYQRQMSLSILLGVPVASALKPETLMAIQSTYAMQPEQGGQPNAGTSKQGENEATKAQTLAR